MNQATPSGSDERQVNQVDQADQEEFALLKGSWNAVLDNLLAQNRIAWLAYFDARLVSIEGETLVLSFADSDKFVGGHDFLAARNPDHKAALLRAIAEETSLELDVTEVKAG